MTSTFILYYYTTAKFCGYSSATVRKRAIGWLAWPFPQVSLLLPYADEIKQVVAVCVGCGLDASYSFRNTLDKKVEVIGGQDTYRALCRACYLDESCRRDSVLDDKDDENRVVDRPLAKEDDLVSSDLPRKVFRVQ
ncbi:hypothetical protein ANCDUO_11595 [Ancylostoma duodenale]|uniref:Thymidine kinase n=1 Tax=Ancylostoma duodenale TaxID=51022 RepID=A0A0C2GMB0_9BILA|nr:hypothetical protein ANCDUO_11595 [Ancylostoma duodenale]